MNKELPYVFGEHTPARWLAGNTWPSRRTRFPFCAILALGDTAMGGNWLGIIAFGILFQPGFPLVGKSLSAMFHALGLLKGKEDYYEKELT
jgi:hypothetical protein